MGSCWRVQQVGIGKIVDGGWGEDWRQCGLRAATDKFIALYRRFIAELWRILSGVMANFIAGVWLDYGRIIAELCKDYGNIMAELLQRCSNFGACRDRNRTRDKLESCCGKLGIELVSA